ncbi:alpha/beta-hydrolase [Viridothelium virens]|uniref:Alpha/beta-hydrolase n=1 Tax=Viridothelium virens TaxID=1048519 RepID=A0A6A6HDT7_VIRVR|nr:alpha/beta-hydrolase [Viridothelium virens]
MAVTPTGLAGSRSHPTKVTVSNVADLLNRRHGAYYHAHSRASVIRINPLRRGRRDFSISSLPTALVVPTVFFGLLVTLWTYKCFMMVLFQNKIIYMPSIPPFSRSEKIADYAHSCSPVVWEERRIKSPDGTLIALCVGTVPIQRRRPPPRNVTILYFQGNGSSLPPRLPGLSQVLRNVSGRGPDDESSTSYTLVGLSYRGYWTSRGRPSQRGIELDAQAALSWTLSEFRRPGSEDSIILWGQSIGAGVATTAAAAHFLIDADKDTDKSKSVISGIILETPFMSIRSMLTTLYPQRWLPYRYLWPFLWNSWDSEAALQAIAKAKAWPKLLIVQAEKDEVVPKEQTDRLAGICREVGFSFSREIVRGALHTEVLAKGRGRTIIQTFLRDAH